MSSHDAQRLLDRYFAATGAWEDFSRFYAPDVTWTMVDTDQEVRGARAVRDYILELHSRMRGGGRRPLVVGGGHAVLEGDAGDADGTGQALSFCLVYDLRDDRISGMRCYGSIARLMASSG